MKKLYTSIIILLSFINNISAQKDLDFGVVSSKIIMQKSHEVEKTANAEIVYDYGKCIINQQNTLYGTVQYFTRTVRIKIYNDLGLNKGDFSINLLNNKNKSDKITHIEGITYNIIDGSIVKTYLNPKLIKNKTISEYNKKAIFTMPNLKAGSVIDVRYVISSPFIFSIPQWYFQHDVPVTYSAFKCVSPVWMDLTENFTGNIDNVKFKHSTNKGEISKENVLLAYSKNSKSFKTNDFSPTTLGYATNVSFTTKSLKKDDETVAITWQTIRSDYLKHKRGGASVKPSRETTRILNNLATKGLISSSNREEMVKQIFKYVSSNYSWNHNKTVFRTKSNIDLLSSKTGSSGDINLLLTQLLKDASIKAMPVLISTRENGVIHSNYPNAQLLNHVITMVYLNGKTIYLDATIKNSPFGMLPLSDVNGTGLIISYKKDNIWTTITPQSTSTTRRYDIGFSEKMEMLVLARQSVNGHHAVDAAQRFNSEEGKKEELNKLAKEVQSKSIDKFNAEIKGGKGVITYNYFTRKYSEYNNNNQLIIKTLISDQHQNIFTAKKRNTPVVLSHLSNNKSIISYHIPDGFKIVSVPENKAIKLLNGSGHYIFKTTVELDVIKVIAFLKIEKQIFSIEEYPKLKEFFEVVAKKENENIVLERI